MTPQQLKAMKLALEALELLTGAWQTFDALDCGDNAITAIKEALAEHAMSEVQRLGQEIEPDDIASILACRDMLDAQPVPPRTEQEPWCMKMNGCKTKCEDCPDEPPQRTEQEPVAWMDADGNVSDNNDHKCFPIPLYTQPPQRTWVNLPDEEIKILWIQYRAALPRYLCFAKALLARAKEKNT